MLVAARSARSFRPRAQPRTRTSRVPPTSPLDPRVEVPVAPGIDGVVKESGHPRGNVLTHRSDPLFAPSYVWSPSTKRMSMGLAGSRRSGSPRRRSDPRRPQAARARLELRVEVRPTRSSRAGTWRSYDHSSTRGPSRRHINVLPPLNRPISTIARCRRPAPAVEERGLVEAQRRHSMVRAGCS